MNPVNTIEKQGNKNVVLHSMPENNKITSKSKTCSSYECYE